MRQSNKKSMKKAKYPNFIFIRGNHADPDTEDEPEKKRGEPGEPGGDNGQNKPPPP
jgi:hypothetical protein